MNMDSTDWKFEGNWRKWSGITALTQSTRQLLGGLR